MTSSCFDRFDSLSKKINELQPPDQGETQTDDESSPKNPSDSNQSDSGSSGAPSADDERGVATASVGGSEGSQPRKRESGAETGRGAEKPGAAGVTGDRSDNNSRADGDGRPIVEIDGDQGRTRTQAGGGDSEGDVSPAEAADEGLGEVPESEEDRKRREEVELLENKRAGIMMEMLTCSHFHHVFEDSNADEGLVPDMPGDDEEDADSPDNESTAEGSKAEGS